MTKQSRRCRIFSAQQREGAPKVPRLVRLLQKVHRSVFHHCSSLASTIAATRQIPLKQQVREVFRCTQAEPAYSTGPSVPN